MPLKLTKKPELSLFHLLLDPEKFIHVYIIIMSNVL